MYQPVRGPLQSANQLRVLQSAGQVQSSLRAPIFCQSAESGTLCGPGTMLLNCPYILPISWEWYTLRVRYYAAKLPYILPISWEWYTLPARYYAAKLPYTPANQLRMVHSAGQVLQYAAKESVYSANQRRVVYTLRAKYCPNWLKVHREWRRKEF